MLKDIPQHKVENLVIAITPPENGNKEDLWNVLIINLHERPIESIMVVAKGYGELTGEQRKTGTFRYFIEEIGSHSYTKIEPIDPSLFALANEYWVSFSLNNHLFDKKYVFVKGSITTDNFTLIPLVKEKGVMIR